MAWVSITESRGLVKHSTDDTYMPLLDNIASHLVSFSPTARQSSAFNANTRVITVISTADCFVAIGANPTATTAAGVFLSSGVYRTLPCAGSDKLSAISAS